MRRNTRSRGQTTRRTFLAGVGGAAALSSVGVVGAKPDGAPRTVVLRSKDADELAARAFPTTDAAYSKRGSWFTTGDDSDGPRGSDKLQFYIVPSAKPFNLGSFTLGDIQSLSYHTKKVGAPVDGSHAPNIYVNIYTEPDNEDDTASWYGYRLNWEPYLSNNLDAPADTWVEWSTDPGTNQLTFFDAANLGFFGFYGQPTLQDLQSGTINWNDHFGSATDKEIDYASETVKFIVFDTGSGWADDHEGYLDAIELVVNSGRGKSGKPTALRIELEA
ncbi:hypothetical protein [Halogeometricum borinquense]|uniref:hypothetical protein n=1 Tax=Halogeometricum borinquense TaxID=60847 RepID=UPI0013EA97AF|nr:hypothetical protein [Halogeometricum borinquense]